MRDRSSLRPRPRQGQGEAMRRECTLVVEDDQAVQEVVTLSLSDVFDVKQATTGAEALRIVHCDPVAAVSPVECGAGRCSRRHTLSLGL